MALFEPVDFMVAVIVAKDNFKKLSRLIKGEYGTKFHDAILNRDCISVNNIMDRWYGSRWNVPSLYDALNIWAEDLDSYIPGIGQAVVNEYSEEEKIRKLRQYMGRINELRNGGR